MTLTFRLDIQFLSNFFDFFRNRLHAEILSLKLCKQARQLAIDCLPFQFLGELDLLLFRQLTNQRENLLERNIYLECGFHLQYSYNPKVNSTFREMVVSVSIKKVVLFNGKAAKSVKDKYSAFSVTLR